MSKLRAGEQGKTKNLESTSFPTLRGWDVILAGESVAATETQAATDHERARRGRARAGLQDPLTRWLRNVLSWLLPIFLSVYWLLCWKRVYWSHRGKLGSPVQVFQYLSRALTREAWKSQVQSYEGGAESQSLILGTASGEQELAPSTDESSVSASLHICHRLTLCRWLATALNGSIYKAVINRHCNSGFVGVVVGETVYQSHASGHSPLYREPAYQKRQNPMFETFWNI